MRGLGVGGVGGLIYVSHETIINAYIRTRVYIIPLNVHFSESC